MAAFPPAAVRRSNGFVCTESVQWTVPEFHAATRAPIPVAVEPSDNRHARRKARALARRSHRCR
jgi:hypothetical protein